MRRRVRTIAGVQANAGIEAQYRRRLDALIEEMHASLLYWLRAQYRKTEPVTLAEDRSPAKELDARMRRLSRRWLKRFDDVATEMAKHFSTSVANRSDSALRAGLKKAGWTVQFKMTPAMRDALDAVTAENVGLIKSIASEHLTDVQGILMRSVARGHDLHMMSKELQERYGVTKRRAALIARDQNNKANAIIVKTRQKELGIVEAIWMHSTAGKHPRPTHVAMNGKRYPVAEGMFDSDEGRNVQPGELINCRCFSKSVIPGLS